jgi:hypothetical protein
MSYIADEPISARLDSDNFLAKLNLSNAEYNDVAILNAREDFGLFRKQIRKGMIWGWWTQEVAWQLQRFYEDMVAGRRPKLAISAPPQHGKSWAATDFIAYVAGKMPDKKTIFGSYSDDLGVRTNNDLQRIIMGEPFRRIFPGTRISSETTTGSDRWKRNSSLIEFINHQGSFRNTTVSGQINGLELHLGVIDDPLKGREEARRLNARNKVWDWFADDFLSRFAKDAALLVVMTRWDVDDLLGRYIGRFPDVRMLNYPAIAEYDEQFRRKGAHPDHQHEGRSASCSTTHHHQAHPSTHRHAVPSPVCLSSSSLLTGRPERGHRTTLALGHKQMWRRGVVPKPFHDLAVLTGADRRLGPAGRTPQCEPRQQVGRYFLEREASRPLYLTLRPFGLR